MLIGSMRNAYQALPHKSRAWHALSVQDYRPRRKRQMENAVKAISEWIASEGLDPAEVSLIVEFPNDAAVAKAAAAFRTNPVDTWQPPQAMLKNVYFRVRTEPEGALGKAGSDSRFQTTRPPGSTRRPRGRA